MHKLVISSHGSTFYLSNQDKAYYTECKLSAVNNTFESLDFGNPVVLVHKEEVSTAKSHKSMLDKALECRSRDRNLNIIRLNYHYFV